MTELAFNPAEVKLGKLAPKLDPRTLKFAKYATAELPAAPDTLDLSTKVATFPMLANDQFGDCTCAAAGHMEEVWTSFTTPYVPTDAEALDFYWATANPPVKPCPPGGDGDTGRVELDVLKVWKGSGFGDEKRKISAFASVNVKNVTEVKQGAWLFGGLYIGVALPVSAQTQKVWDVVADAGANGEAGSWGGHAINVVAYDDKTVTVVTWGALLQMTWAFWNEYVDEAYAILTSEWIEANGDSPTGFDLASLQSDLADIQ